MRTLEVLLAVGLATFASLAHAAPPETIAVLPIKVSDPGASEAAPLLAAALVDELAATGHFQVISADEVAALVQVETERQGVGAGDDSAVLEAAQALGAKRVVVAQLTRAGNRNVWSVSMLDPSNGTVVQRAEASGASVQTLLAQTRDVVLSLEGRGAETRLAGKPAARRLGFADVDDVARFRGFREDHPESSTSEALTRFLVDHNVESDRLALLQAAIFTAPVVLVALAALAVGMLNGARGSWGLPGAIFLNMLSAGVILVTPLVLTLLAAGVALVVVDALDTGFVDVTADGCCRDDSAIQEARERNGLRKAAEMWLALTAPASCLGIVGMFMLGTTLSGVATFFIPPQPLSPLGELTGVLYCGGAIPCLCCMSAVTPLTSLVTGLVVLLWSEPDPIGPARRGNDVEAK